MDSKPESAKEKACAVGGIECEHLRICLVL